MVDPGSVATTTVTKLIEQIIINLLNENETLKTLKDQVTLSHGHESEMKKMKRKLFD